MNFIPLATTSPMLSPRATAIAGVLVAYIAVCRGLRYLRRDTKHASYPYKTREEYKKMTSEHAYEIVSYFQSLECPWISAKALSFALFKTYGIPSISKLLCETQQLGKAQYVGRRYADTSILIAEFLAHSPTSERANSAIARMNYLHSRYQKAGKISNDDMLYTLSLFLLEVERWTRLYDWRTLTPMEMCAFGTHWKSVGDAMGIDFSALRHGPSNFRDGLEFFDDVKEWAHEYERRKMVPDEYNHQLAEGSTDLLLTNVPGPFKPYGKNFVVALMDDRLRSAMLYEKPPQAYFTIIKFVFGVRNVLLKYLMPPRPYALKHQIVGDQADLQTGRYHLTEYIAQPWYYKSTFSTRNSSLAWYRWAIGVAYPGDGKQYKSEGYDIFEVGPAKMEQHGREECMAAKDRLMASHRDRCPFAFQ